jgi:hypothetical protein
MSFIKVLTDVDGVVSTLPARIIATLSDGSYNIKYISKTEKKHTNGKSIYEYEDEIYNITEESIDEYMYDEAEFGLKLISAEEGTYIKQSNSCDDGGDDEDYIPGTSSSSDSESEEDEEEDDDEDEDDYDDEDCEEY